MYCNRWYFINSWALTNPLRFATNYYDLYYLMLEFINIKRLLNPNQGNSWKLPFKIGIFCILIGYTIFILKEIIVGFISLIFFVIGIYCFYLAYNIWRIDNSL